MITDPWFYAVAIPAVLIVGITKGGFAVSVSIIGVPLMALVIPPIEAAAIMLPILLLSDAVALFAWRGVFDRRSVAILLPSTIFGMAVAWAFASMVTDAHVRLIVGLIALLFTVYYMFGGASRRQPKPADPVKGWFWGTISGFTGFVSHAGAPPMQMYLLPLRLDPRPLAGTIVLVFAISNLLKVVPYLALGQFTWTNLATSAVLLPLAPLATWFGARLVHIVSEATFYRVSYAGLFIIGVKLLWDGLAGAL